MNLRQLLLLLLPAFLLPIAAADQASEIASQVASETDQAAPHDAKICSPDGVALGGHDVVAYHVQEAAVLGDSAISTVHDGLSYHFSSEQHKALFVENPDKYLPHFRGWCAIALARNRLTCPEYENFKIEDGKLLLFETIAFVNGRNVWDSNPVKNLISAEQNFRRFLQE